MHQRRSCAALRADPDDVEGTVPVLDVGVPERMYFSRAPSESTTVTVKFEPPDHAQAWCRASAPGDVPQRDTERALRAARPRAVGAGPLAVVGGFTDPS